MENWVQNKTSEEQTKRYQRELFIFLGTFGTILFVVILVATLVYLFVVDIVNARNDVSRHMMKHPEWYQMDFPENEFPPHRSFAAEYHNRKMVGQNYIREKQLIIIGLARDIFPRLKDNLARLQKVGNLFQDFKIVVFENDSKDGTREYLEALSLYDASHVELIPCYENSLCRLKTKKATDYGVIDNTRLEKMAYFRNRTLNYVKAKYENWADYVMVVDLDLAGPMSLEGFCTNFSFPNWDVMSAYGVSSALMSNNDGLSYYDTMAFVAPHQNPYSIIRKWNFIPLLTARYQRGEPPIYVKSAFGGATIYTMKSLVESRAQYTAEGGICEHVGLHINMRERGFDKIFINPSWMILHTSNEFV